MAYLPLDTQTSDTGSELRCPGSSKLICQVSNAAVYIAFGQGAPNSIYDVDEPYLPFTGVLIRDFDAVRVRSKLPGVPAQVMLTAIPAGQA